MEAKKKFYPENLAEIIVSCFNDYVALTALFASAPFLVPTHARLLKEGKISIISEGASFGIYARVYEREIPELIATPAAMTAILGVGFGAAYAYTTYADYRAPLLLLIPVLTNVLSGIYELSRIVKNKYVEKHKAKDDLEHFIDASF